MLFTRSLALALALLVAVPLLLAPAAVSAQGTASNKDISYSREELDQILAPIALYPDDLLSNVLVASTYPLEVVQAARWIEEPANASLKGEALTKALADQDWDPSVKALTQFPDVLAMMSKQLDWTEKLGDAFLASQADVMDRIQFLRDKAEAAGHLKSNEHQTVTTRRSSGSDYIYIEPAAPDVVYVPVYEPDVYGDWWYPDYPPYYWPADGAYVDDYYWGSGVSVFLPLWGWATPRWHDHYIHVDVRRYNRFSRHRKITSSRWRASAHHRRGVKYRSHHRDGRKPQLDYRGHNGKQVLKPGTNRRLDAIRAPIRAHKRKHAGPSVSAGSKQHHRAGVKIRRNHDVSSTPRKKKSSARKHSKGRSSAHRHSRKRSSAQRHSRKRSSAHSHSKRRSGAKAHRGGGRKAGVKRGGGKKHGRGGGGRKKKR